jgi:hypothetical protein
MSDLTPREVIDRIARGLELTRQEFAKPKAAADGRRPIFVMVKRKKARTLSARSARSIGRPVRHARVASSAVSRGRQAMTAVVADKRLAADKLFERLLHSLREERDALALKEHAESVAQSRLAIYFVLTFAAGVIAGVLSVKLLWPMIQA